MLAPHVIPKLVAGVAAKKSNDHHQVDIHVPTERQEACENEYGLAFEERPEEEGKVAEVSEDPSTNNITVVAEDTLSGEKVRQEVDMVVLATGMQPTAAAAKVPADVKYNDDGFIINDFDKGGMFAAGCATKPADVITSNQNATGMALKAIQTLVKR